MKQFFFAKKNQKTLFTLGYGLDAASATGPDSKSLFGSRRASPVFLQEKKFTSFYSKLKADYIP
jgi:hypothetical protein